MAARAGSIWETKVSILSSQSHMLLNTKQESKQEPKPEMIDYLLSKKYFGNPKAIDAFDDEHRTAVSTQKSLLYKQYRLPSSIASSRGLALAHGLCEVVNRIWSEC